jgi:predicted DNA binding protein
MTNGEICFISGLPKVGKSTVTSFVLATALMPEIPETLDTLKIRTDYTTKNIIYIDTEQSRSGTAATLQRVLKIANLKECPPNLKYFNVRQYGIQERIEIFKCICNDLPNIAFVVVDGITDFLNGVNDEVSSNEAIEMLMFYSSKLDIPILSIIHETYGGKLRGQFGSQGERKGSGVITIKKHKELKCFSISPKFIRYGADFDDVFYHYNPLTQTIETLDFEETQKAKKAILDTAESTQALKEILEQTFKDAKSGLTEKEVKKGIKDYQVDKPDATRDAINGQRRRNFESMVRLGLLEFRDNLYYYTLLEQEPFETQSEIVF